MQRDSLFTHLAASCARHDFLAREVDRRMQESLDFIRLAPALILDFGACCGTRLDSLAQRYPEARVLAVDQNFPGAQSLCEAVLANEARLPLSGDTVDLVWSNLRLHQWAEPSDVLMEALRVLRTGGLFMFSALGPDTLKELRASFSDQEETSLPFRDVRAWGDQLLACGFADPVMDRENILLDYDSFAALLADLQAGSARCAENVKRPSFPEVSFWQKVEAAYPKMGSRWPASVEVIYGHAWKLPLDDKDTSQESVLRFYR